jgi:Protein-L-isoaspartate(D-aspartate) O-methyltransferase (PCMT)
MVRPIDLASERERMVQRLIGDGLLRSPAVIAALTKVPRELFVSEELRPYAYNDTPLPTDRGQTISAPHGKRSRAIHGGHNERGAGPEDRRQSARGGCR